MQKETEHGRNMMHCESCSWEELGRMLMTFEGWQFRMEIRDRSEEV